MTQEEKDLLLKDLCTRLPYEPICEFTDIEDEITATAKLGYSLRDFVSNKVLVKPYLRPISIMTEDEKDTLRDYGWVVDNNTIYSDCGMDANGQEYGSIQMSIDDTKWLMDFLNSHHFDYRGLIEKGLALEAPEGMYNIED